MGMRHTACANWQRLFFNVAANDKSRYFIFIVSTKRKNSALMHAASQPVYVKELWLILNTFEVFRRSTTKSYQRNFAEQRERNQLHYRNSRDIDQYWHMVNEFLNKWTLILITTNGKFLRFYGKENI